MKINKEDEFESKYFKKDLLKYKKEYNVSVIVPNYNNEKYLDRRLKTILNQTILPYEIIIIDDKSSDNSLIVINNYISEFKKKNIKTKLIVNDINTGSGYFNWIKGIKLATCELIWIAESDDYCDLNFIEKLINYFNDLSVSITYSNTIFVDKKGNQIWTMEDYLNNNKWKQNFIKSTIKLVYNIWSYKNIIPNVSSCIFRKPDKNILNVIDSFLEKGLRLNIDWLFYLLISKNSSIGYSVNTNNYYLNYNNSTSKKIQKKKCYLNEHIHTLKYIIENFKINKNNINLLYENLKKHCLENSLSLKYLDNIYDINYFYNLHNSQTINKILIYNYSFEIGGGEIFPIYLANELYENNIDILFMTNYDKNVNLKILDLLNPNIRIVNNYNNIENIIKDFDITHVNTHHQLCDSVILNYKKEKYISNDKLKHYITDHGMYNTKSAETLHLFNLINHQKTNIVCIAKNNLKNYTDLSTPIFELPITIKDYKINKNEEIKREDLNLKDTDFIITLASRGLKEKGWVEIIQIVKLLNRKYNNVHLLLIGDYSNEYTTSLKNKYENDNNIHFLGFQEKVKRFFNISDLGVLPTYYDGETTPIVLFECLYSNIPFISSNIGDIKTMLYGKYDYAGSVIDLLNNQIDILSYLKELKCYITNKEYYLKKQNEIKYAIEKLTKTQNYEKYINMFFNKNNS
jgi:glycosyltransferase involved in cell wall biosynthesis